MHGGNEGWSIEHLLHMRPEETCRYGRLALDSSRGSMPDEGETTHGSVTEHIEIEDVLNSHLCRG